MLKKLLFTTLLFASLGAMAQQNTAPAGRTTVSLGGWGIVGTGATSRIVPYFNGYYYPWLTLQDTTSLLATKYNLTALGGSYVPVARLVSTGYGLLGGGNLGSNLTLYTDSTKMLTLARYKSVNDTLYNKNTYSLRLLAINNASVVTPSNGVNIFGDSFANTFGFKGANSYAGLISNRLLSNTTLFSLPNSGNAILMTNPLTTAGDIPYLSSNSTTGANVARLGIGSSGDILTVSGGMPIWANGSGSYIQNKNGSTSVQANSKIVVSDTIRSNTALIAPLVLAKDSLVVNNYTSPTQTIAFLGNSITYGSGSTPSTTPITNGYAQQVAKASNVNINNLGTPFATIDLPLTTQWASIPAYNATTSPYIYTSWGANEYAAQMTIAQYRAKYNALLDSLNSLKGYPFASIKVIQMQYICGNNFAITPQQYAAVDSAAAVSKGATLIRTFWEMASTGGSYY